MACRRVLAGLLVLVVLVVGGGGVIGVRGQATGPLLRTVPIDANAGPLAVDERTGRVFVAGSSDGAHSYAGSVDVLDASDGRVLRRVILATSAIPQAVAVDRPSRHVFVLNQNQGRYSDGNQLTQFGTVDVLDAVTGRLIRAVSLPTGYNPTALAVDERTERVFAASEDANASNPFTGSGRVSVLDARSGRLLRTIALFEAPRAMVVDAGAGRVAVFGMAGPFSGSSVIMLDARSGTLLRTGTTRTSLPSLKNVLSLSAAGAVAAARNLVSFVSVSISTDEGPAAIAVDEQTGRAYILQDTGAVDVLDSRRGVVLQTITLPGFAVALAADWPARRVYVTTISYALQSGVVQRTTSLDVLDAGSGGLLRAIPVATRVDRGADTIVLGAGNAAPMAVDVRTGHVFTVVDGGSVRVADAWGLVPDWLRRRLPFLPRPTFRTRSVPASLNTLDPA